MFTGLIEAIGEVTEIKAASNGLRLRVRTGLSAGLKVGDSLAVEGVCLTISLIEGEEAHFYVGHETINVTVVGSFKPGQRVNLERAMRADTRVGGHFVSGHIDGTGSIDTICIKDKDRRLTIEYPASLAAQLIAKGSIAVNGVSLTIADLGKSKFDVMIIPFTWEHTSLSSLKLHDRVNLECDMIGKYVLRSVDLSTFDVRRRFTKAH
jgi:riboflavin synthase